MADDQLSPTAVRIAVALVALLAVGVVVAGLVLTSGDEPVTNPSTTAAPRTGPVAVVGVDAPDARSADCASLMKALPNTLPDSGKTLHRLAIAKPAPPAAAVWGGDRGEPVVLRCGLPRPDELTPTSALRDISGVQWLPIEGAGATTWVVVDRAVYVALTVPAGSGTGPLQDVSAAVGGALPARPVRVRG
ncbi:MAG TPA: DUF3515 domain-containing protein [Actinophytocola sp.]|uniref:DUF3515 domain-containing protein n=1 Tax=Actinophytocola sp. TaxID=1872138 RepID=UPI002F952CD8